MQIKNPGRKDVCGKRAVNIKNKSGSQHKKIGDHWTPGAITYYVRSGNRSAISYCIYICLSCLKKNLNSSNQNKNHLFTFGKLLRLSINLFECSIYLYHLPLRKGENLYVPFFKDSFIILGLKINSLHLSLNSYGCFFRG